MLQARTAGDEYVFPHQTFQEYLAGLQLVSKARFVNEIMALRQEDRWRVPIFLGIGHAVNESLYAIPYQLLNRLRCATARTAEQRQRDLIFAAEIAEDVGWTRLLRGGDEFHQLRHDLAQDLVAVVEGTVLPAAERVRAGELLGSLDDPRPGVCSLPPAMVEFTGGSFQIGITKPELAQIVEEERHGRWASQAQSWYSDALNTTPVQIKLFELARYPVTNAQYAIFIAQGGYDPAQPWWNDAARRWLRRDDQATEGLDPWQRRTVKHQPEFWDDPRFGKTRPNHPVVGISWYEATTFCEWLKHYLNDGYVYCLPSEPEWEYAARGLERRTYPWGNQPPDGELANFDNCYGGTTAVGCFAAGATPGGAVPPGATAPRLFDLAGNVWGWTRSEYRNYPYNANDGRENPAEPAKKYFTVRGGSWANDPIALRAADRVHNPPGTHGRNLGCRLARYLPV
ncbi:MAG: formylglycine-generating enzyme family protein [Oscillochloridaceae bacterium umkhey_bin13]